MNHNNVISLPGSGVIEAGDALVINSAGKASRPGNDDFKEKHIGVALQDFDSSESSMAVDIQLFCHASVANVNLDGLIEPGDAVAVESESHILVPLGDPLPDNQRQVGVSLTSVTAAGVHSIDLLIQERVGLGVYVSGVPIQQLSVPPGIPDTGTMGMVGSPAGTPTFNTVPRPLPADNSGNPGSMTLEGSHPTGTISPVVIQIPGDNSGNPGSMTLEGSHPTHSALNSVTPIPTATTWTGESADDRFGWDVGMDEQGYTVAIGASYRSSQDGEVYTHYFDGGSWQAGDTMTGPTDGELGRSLAVSKDGSHMVIAGPQFNNRGHAEVWEQTSPGTWSLKYTFTAVQLPNVGGQFNVNRNVAISADGSRVVIGEPMANIGGLSDNGQVRVFEWNGTTAYAQIGQTIVGAASKDSFGYAVDIIDDGSKIVVGAPQRTADDPFGYIHLYEYDGVDTWTLDDSIAATSNYEFGYSVSISGDGTWLAVGNPLRLSNNGGFQIYKYVGGSFDVANVTTWGGAGRTGESLSISTNGDKLIVGKPESSAGAAGVYSRSGDTWSKVSDVSTPTGLDAGDGHFGYRVAISGDGNVAIVGGYTWDSNGAAWLLVLDGSDPIVPIPV